MDTGDIRRVQQDWVAAAVRARDVGFDIVYVYGAHSFLLLAIPLPDAEPEDATPTAATLENRARLWLETLELVREAVGSDCAIAARFAVEALGPWGVSTAEGLGFVQMADHLVDLWDITVGAVAGMARIDSAASRFFGEGYELKWTHEVRQVTDKPLVGVGRFTNPDTMAALVRSRELDLIGAARPSIADPFLPRKIEEGRYDEIRECIGCNFCYSRAEYSGHLGCTQNAAAGEEHRRGWHPEVFTPGGERRSGRARRRCRARRHRVRDRARQTGLRPGAPRRGRERDRWHGAVDPEASRASASGVGSSAGAPCSSRSCARTSRSSRA